CKDAKGRTQREEEFEFERTLGTVTTFLLLSWRLSVLSQAGVKTVSRKDAKTQRQRRKGKRAAE
ncbi:MAG: hypothetical protein ACKN82_12450, partial [Pirellula sp.]